MSTPTTRAKDNTQPRWPLPSALERSREAGERAERERTITETLGEATAPGVAGWLERAGATPEDIEAALASHTSSALAHESEAIGWPDGAEAVAATLWARRGVGRIGVFADYDVDGAAAAAIMNEAVRAIDERGLAALETAERDSEGFGPNDRALEALASAGAKTAVVLDCGTEAGTLLDAWADKDLCPVVIDHHPARGRPTPARGIVLNPHLAQGGHQAMCTAALAWWVAIACLRTAEVDRRGSAPVRRRITALAALATDCDNMSVNPRTVDGRWNRALVNAGIRMMAHASVGLTALMDATRANPAKISADTLGFKLGATINAGSRAGRSNLAMRCLTETDETPARALAAGLVECNRARREATSAGFARAIASIGKSGASPITIVWDAALAPGCTGVVAAQLLERDPSRAWLVMGRHEGDGPWRGSGRSAHADLGEALARALDAGAFEGGGGHALACGAVVAAGAEARAEQTLSEALNTVESERGAPTCAPERQVDIRLARAALTPARLEGLRAALERLAPYGPGWRAPTIGVRSVRCAQASRRTGARAVLMHIEGPGETVKAIWWNAPHDWLATLGEEAGHREYPERTIWRGRSRALDLIGAIAGDSSETPVLMVREVRPA